MMLPLAMLLAVATAPAPQSAPHDLTSAESRKVDAIAAREIHAKRTPGLAIGIVEDGRLVYAKGFGYANLQRHIAFTPETQSYTGSISEQFTAAAILLLQQDGKLELDDKVTKFLPELTCAQSITIAQLLQQTSGLPSVAKLPGINSNQRKGVKRTDLIAALDKAPLASAPGSQFAFNPLNYWVAAQIVERASSVPLSDYLQQNIFLPLVMTSSFYAGDTGISDDRAVGYTGSPGHFTVAKRTDPSWLLGSGGVVSDIYDLAKWDIEMPVLLRVDAVRDMFTASAVPGDLHYGMGWVIDQRGGQSYIWRNGMLPGYHAMNALLPDAHVAVIVLTNADPFGSSGVTLPESVTAEILDAIAPISHARLDNTIVTRAREWLARLADQHIDRTQLTPSFSSYLSDDLIARSHFARMGTLASLTPISSAKGTGNDTVYEFIARYPKRSYRYRFTVTAGGKIDGLQLTPEPAN